MVVVGCQRQNRKWTYLTLTQQISLSVRVQIQIDLNLQQIMSSMEHQQILVDQEAGQFQLNQQDLLMLGWLKNDRQKGQLMLQINALLMDDGAELINFVAVVAAAGKKFFVFIDFYFHSFNFCFLFIFFEQVLSSVNEALSPVSLVSFAYYNCFFFFSFSFPLFLSLSLSLATQE